MSQISVDKINIIFIYPQNGQDLISSILTFKK